MKLFKLIVTTMVVTTPLIYGCGKEGNSKNGFSIFSGEKKQTTFVLFDLGVSTKWCWSTFKQDFDTLAKELTGNHTLIFDSISHNSISTSNPFKIDFSPPDDASTKVEKADLEKKLALLQSELAKRLEAAKRELKDYKYKKGSSVSRSDISTAIRTMASLKNSKSARDSDELHLVIFSDMIEQTPTHDFTTPGLLSETGRKAMINSIKVAGTLPDLNGFDVTIVGAGSTDETGISPRTLELIKAYWLEYFREAGAEIDSSSMMARYL